MAILQPSPTRRRRPGVRSGMAAAAAIVVFVVGIAVGRALKDNPKPGGTQTRVRTLMPATVRPPASTVTATVTEP